MLKDNFEIILLYPEIEEVREYIETPNRWTEGRVKERLSEVRFLMSRLSTHQNQWLSLVHRTCNPALRWSCKLLECAYKFSGNLSQLDRYYELCVELFGGDKGKFQVCEFMLMCYLITQALKYKVPITSSKDVLGIRSWALKVLRRNRLNLPLRLTPFLSTLIPKGCKEDSPLYVTFLEKVDVKRLSRLIRSVIKSNKIILSNGELSLNLSTLQLCSFPYLDRFLNLLLDNFKCDKVTNFLSYVRLHESLSWVRRT